MKNKIIRFILFSSLTIMFLGCEDYETFNYKLRDLKSRELRYNELPLAVQKKISVTRQKSYDNFLWYAEKCDTDRYCEFAKDIFEDTLGVYYKVDIKKNRPIVIYNNNLYIPKKSLDWSDQDQIRSVKYMEYELKGSRRISGIGRDR